MGNKYLERTRRYLIISDAGDGEPTSYDVQHGDHTPSPVDPKVTLMRFSADDTHWTSLVRGKVAAKIIDDGNVLKVRMPARGTDSTKVKFNIDYCQLQELRILLNLINDQDRMPAKEKVFREEINDR